MDRLTGDTGGESSAESQSESILSQSRELPSWATRQTAAVPPNTHRLAECPGCIAEHGVQHSCGLKEEPSMMTPRSTMEPYSGPAVDRNRNVIVSPSGVPRSAWSDDYNYRYHQHQTSSVLRRDVHSHYNRVPEVVLHPQCTCNDHVPVEFHNTCMDPHCTYQHGVEERSRVPFNHHCLDCAQSAYGEPCATHFYQNQQQLPQQQHQQLVQPHHQHQHQMASQNQQHRPVAPQHQLHHHQVGGQTQQLQHQMVSQNQQQHLQMVHQNQQIPSASYGQQWNLPRTVAVTYSKAYDPNYNSYQGPSASPQDLKLHIAENHTPAISNTSGSQSEALQKSVSTPAFQLRQDAVRSVGSWGDVRKGPLQTSQPSVVQNLIPPEQHKADINKDGNVELKIVESMNRPPCESERRNSDSDISKPPPAPPMAPLSFTVEFGKDATHKNLAMSTDLRECVPARLRERERERERCFRRSSSIERDEMDSFDEVSKKQSVTPETRRKSLASTTWNQASAVRSGRSPALQRKLQSKTQSFDTDEDIEVQKPKRVTKATNRRDPHRLSLNLNSKPPSGVISKTHQRLPSDEDSDSSYLRNKKSPRNDRNFHDSKSAANLLDQMLFNSTPPPEDERWKNPVDGVSRDRKSESYGDISKIKEILLWQIKSFEARAADNDDTASIAETYTVRADELPAEEPRKESVVAREKISNVFGVRNAKNHGQSESIEDIELMVVESDDEKKCRKAVVEDKPTIEVTISKTTSNSLRSILSDGKSASRRDKKETLREENKVVMITHDPKDDVPSTTTTSDDSSSMKGSDLRRRMLPSVPIVSSFGDKSESSDESSQRATRFKKSELETVQDESDAGRQRATKTFQKDEESCFVVTYDAPPQPRRELNASPMKSPLVIVNLNRQRTSSRSSDETSEGRIKQHKVQSEVLNGSLVLETSTNSELSKTKAAVDADDLNQFEPFASTAKAVRSSRVDVANCSAGLSDGDSGSSSVHKPKIHQTRRCSSSGCEELKPTVRSLPLSPTTREPSRNKINLRASSKSRGEHESVQLVAVPKYSCASPILPNRHMDLSLRRSLPQDDLRQQHDVTQRSHTRSSNRGKESISTPQTSTPNTSSQPLSARQRSASRGKKSDDENPNSHRKLKKVPSEICSRPDPNVTLSGYLASNERGRASNRLSNVQPKPTNTSQTPDPTISTHNRSSSVNALIACRSMTRSTSPQNNQSAFRRRMKYDPRRAVAEAKANKQVRPGSRSDDTDVSSSDEVSDLMATSPWKLNGKAEFSENGVKKMADLSSSITKLTDAHATDDLSYEMLNNVFQSSERIKGLTDKLYLSLRKCFPDAGAGANFPTTDAHLYSYHKNATPQNNDNPKLDETLHNLKETERRLLMSLQNLPKS